MDDELFAGPSAAELVGAVAELLESILGEVPPNRVFALRSALTALGIVGRELDDGTAITDEHAAMLAELGFDGDEQLARSIRDGSTRVDARLVAALLDDARRRLVIDSPR